MKTVSQVARELGVTPKTIYKRLNRVKPTVTPGNDEVKPGLTQCLTVKQGAITYVTEDGEKYLIECLVKPTDERYNTGNTEVKPGYTEVTQGNTHVMSNKDNENEEILFLREQVKSLQEELKAEREHSRQKSDEISDMAQKLLEITRNQQVLLGAEQSRTNPALRTGIDNEVESIIDNKINPSPEKKWGILNFFKRKR